MRATGTVGATIMLAALMAITACGTPAGGVCPAIGYVPTVNVTLDEAWPGRADLQLDVTCTPSAAQAEPCDLRGESDGPTWRGMVSNAPAAVLVTVRRGAEILTEQTVTLSQKGTDHP